MSAKNKREKARQKAAESTGLTAARALEVFKDLPGDARVRAVDGKILISSPGLDGELFDSGELFVECGQGGG